MKLLILTSSFPYHQGDYHGSFVYYHALGQVRLGNEVIVLCPHVPGTVFNETIDGIRVHRFPYFYPYRLQRVVSDTGMYFGLNSLFSVLQLPFFLLCEFICTHKIIFRYQVDLIHSHWIVPQGLTGSLCLKIWKIPHLISSHVVDVNLFGKYRIFLPLLSLIFSNTDLICTDSTYNKNVIENLVNLQKPCRVIPMGVNVPVREINLNNHTKPVILFVGRLIEWKGVDILIKAMVSVTRTIPDAELYIVGDGPLRNELTRLADNMGLSGKITFFGVVDNEKLSSLYQCASVHVLPSRAYRGLVMEGLGVVLLEAMSRGVPVIGSNTGGITDIIQDGQNGFLFDSGDDRMLAEKIIDLLSNESLANQFREMGYVTVRSKFSWESVSRKFTEAYRELLTEYEKKRTSGRS